MSDLTSLRDWARAMAETDKPLPTTPIVGAMPHKAIPREAFPTDAERVLWRQIANEIDTFLAVDTPAPTEDQGDLFGTTPA